MMKKRPLRSFAPILILFVALNAFLFFATGLLQRWGIDRDVVLWGNMILFAITLLSFMISVRGLGNSNPHAFVRAVYSGVMLKLFGSAIIAFIYISVSGKSLNKPALFVCMALYLVYSFVEVSILTKLLRAKPNE